MSCPDAGNCPVVAPGTPRHLRTHVIEAGTHWYNVSGHEGILNSSGGGDSRFSPLFADDGQPVPHVYLAQNHVGALIESVLHDVWGASSRVLRSDLEGRALRQITCNTELATVDLRDSQLERYRIGRDRLVSSPSEHYACTRAWAHPRRRMQIGRRRTTGFIWHSRQVETAAAHANPTLRVLLSVVEQAAHAAVIYDNDGDGHDWFTSKVLYPDLSAGSGFGFVEELVVPLGLHIEY